MDPRNSRGNDGNKFRRRRIAGWKNLGTGNGETATAAGHLRFIYIYIYIYNALFAKLLKIRRF
jgi:hypothetical protein